MAFIKNKFKSEVCTTSDFFKSISLFIKKECVCLTLFTIIVKNDKIFMKNYKQIYDFWQVSA